MIPKISKDYKSEKCGCTLKREVGEVMVAGNKYKPPYVKKVTRWSIYVRCDDHKELKSK